MAPKFPPLNWDGLKTYSFSKRKSLVAAEDFASPWKKDGSFRSFLKGLPAILAGADLTAVIEAISTAHRSGNTVIFAMGAHVIKVGLNPVVIDLMQQGIISAVAMNGAGIIHDTEIALAGKTSEDVACALDDGSFGMARETAECLNAAIDLADAQKTGLGCAVGQYLNEQQPPHVEDSILATGARLNIPVSVHVAFGTDIIHMHPRFDAAKTGAATHRDFQQLAAVVATLEKGVHLNVGSAVILPEVFLKALTVARNLGHHLEHFTTVNLDFIRHYRPMTNVLSRPTAKGGRGINLVGHHEIMVPLIAAGIIESLTSD
jgi:deoxyhypusine synthase